MACCTRPFFEGHFEAGHDAEAVDDRALAHMDGGAFVDDLAEIKRHGHLVHGDFFVGVHTHFGHLGDVGSVGKIERKTEGAARRKLAAPAGFFRRALDDGGGAARVQRARLAGVQKARLAQNFQEELHMIAARCDGGFVQEALQREALRVGARRAEIAGGGDQRDEGLADAHISHQFGGEMVGGLDRVGDRRVENLGALGGVLAVGGVGDEAVLPAHQLALGVEGGAVAVVAGGA